MTAKNKISIITMKFLCLTARTRKDLAKAIWNPIVMSKINYIEQLIKFYKMWNSYNF